VPAIAGTYNSNKTVSDHANRAGNSRLHFRPIWKTQTLSKSRPGNPRSKVSICEQKP